MTQAVKTNALETLFDSADSSAQYARGFFDRMADLFENLDFDTIARTIAIIEKAQIDNQSIFVIGNGGSAAVASHFVNDLCPNSLIGDQRGFRAFSLTDNVESVTAIANDAGFEHVFSYQLQCQMVPGDVVIALSVSGNSPNIIRAIEFANDGGATTIGWSGFDGGRLAEVAQVALHIPSTLDEYGPVEDIFSNLGHVVTGYLTMKRGRKLSH